MHTINQQLTHEIGERRRAEQIARTFFKITSAVSTTKDLGELYATLHRILGEIIDLTNFFIAIYDKNAGRVSFPYFVDQYDSGNVYADQIGEKNSLTGSVITSEAPVFLDSRELEKRKKENCVVGTTPLVWIGIPLKIEGEVIGVMAAQSYDKPDLYDEFDLDILISVSDQVAVAIAKKRNEQALIESEKKYRTIIETIEDGYFEIDFNDNLTMVNKAMSTMLGCSAEDLLGRDGIDDERRKSGHLLIEPFCRAVRRKQPGNAIEIEFFHEDGRQRYAETVLSNICDVTGRSIGYRGIARDITERKEAEKARKALQEQLQQSQRLESLGTLAGGIAHDFNNLLMGIQGRIELLKRVHNEPLQLQSQLQSIEEYIKSAAALTSRLLGFARGGKYELKPADLNVLIDHSIRMFGRTRKEITINTRLQENIKAVEVDRNQIEQVLINLLVNASQAMKGGGTIMIESTEISVDAQMAAGYFITPGDYIKISVIDSGIGMDKDILKKIFDPFFTTKSIGGGTGLGLAMVYGIMRNHSGGISVESRLSEGSCFSLFFPATEKKAIHCNKPVTEAKCGSETILLVDDEPMITEVGKGILSHLGYEVLVASSGFEALEVFEKNLDCIDLVIIDMIMPGMSGGELFDRLKHIEPAVPVLLSSGYSAAGEAREILERGCRGFIQKPFSVSEISCKIREILSC